MFGSNVNSGSCVFTIENDDIPEVNETFTVQLVPENIHTPPPPHGWLMEIPRGWGG